MFSPDGQHEVLLQKKPVLAFDEDKDLEVQRKEIKEKLLELLGERPQPVDLCIQIEEKTEHEKFTEYRIVFNAEENVQAVCILCIPKLGKKKYPLAICLQGHSTGMHISMGRQLHSEDSPPGTGDRDFALHAIDKGFAALSLDQRGMGERRTVKLNNLNGHGPRCHVTAMNALMLGRTIIGERCFDVSRAIDVALTFDEIDQDKILCTGNSGGGTTTFYAACLDERIKVAMPSCAVCTFKDSIGAMFHCECNYIPNIAKYMDMGDMAALIAPRKLIIVNGKEDPIFPDHGVRETFETVKKIYKAAGVPENCALATGGEGHRYYKKEAWGTFDKMVQW